MTSNDCMDGVIVDAREDALPCMRTTHVRGGFVWLK
jgi:hypothetical protein